MKKLILLAVLLLTACPQQKENKPKDLSAPITPKAELQAAAFDELEGWKKDNFFEILPALKKNCQRISKISTDWLANSAIKIDTKLYKNICRDLEKTKFSDSIELRKFI